MNKSLLLIKLLSLALVIVVFCSCEQVQYQNSEDTVAETNANDVASEEFDIAVTEKHTYANETSDNDSNQVSEIIEVDDKNADNRADFSQIHTPSESISLGSYSFYRDTEIPVLSYNESIGFVLPYKDSIPKIIFDEKKVSDYSIYLIGEHVMKVLGSNDDDVIHSGALGIGISGDNETITSYSPVNDAVNGVSQGGYRLYEDKIEHYMTVYEMDCPLIVITYITKGGSSIGVFYAVKDSEIYMLMGDYSEVGGAPTGVCTLFSGSLIADLEANTLTDIASSITYTFHFDNILPSNYVNSHFIATGSQLDYPDDWIG